MICEKSLRMRRPRGSRDSVALGQEGTRWAARHDTDVFAGGGMKDVAMGSDGRRCLIWTVIRPLDNEPPY